MEEVLDVNVVSHCAVFNETRISLNVSDGGESRKSLKLGSPRL